VEFESTTSLTIFLSEIDFNFNKRKEIHTMPYIVYTIRMVVLSVELDKDLEEKLQFLMKKQKIIDKAKFVELLLTHAINKELLELLSREVRKNNLSTWKAAEIAQISLREMMHELAKREVLMYDETALKKDLSFVEK